MAKKTTKVTKAIKADVEPAPTRGGKSLVIVESPAKAKTINKYLGSRYVVKACQGHVRDLPKGKYAIDPGRNFEPTYEILPTRTKIVSDLRAAAATADHVYLATDLDREGEAIAWHLAHALGLDPEQTQRVIFNEITKSAIEHAFSQPHRIDLDKVNAQQARRIMDRIVGYELSPLLWKKVSKGLSAGRVQSVAVRLIVDRENEIRRFEPQEYWSVDAVFTVELAKRDALAAEWGKLAQGAADPDAETTQKDLSKWLGENASFRAELVEVNGKPFKAEGRISDVGTEKIRFESAVADVRRVVESLGVSVVDVIEEDWNEYARLRLRKYRFNASLIAKSAPAFAIRDIETSRTRTKPYGPFTTASLQQAAANQLRFATSRTMKIAQALYEGVDLGDGEGPVGLITYMRTDSTNLSGESVGAVRKLIGESYGERYLPEQPNRYGSAKGAQEAHEAIRPTDAFRSPDKLRTHLNDEQFKLYTLIWNRFVACQMTPAEWDSTTARIEAESKTGKVAFKAAGRVLAFDGFYRVMGVPKSGEDQLLPPLKTGQPVAPLTIDPRQRFTQPPPRFTEASLVKALESEGIGRPSTYASIIDTIQSRGYVEQEDRKFRPTARGEVVTKKLVDHFPKIMDPKFTSFMEGELDKIEEAHLDWVHVLHEFYDPFKEALGKAHDEMDAVRAEPSDHKCEKCGKPMVYRLGKNGRFLSCTGYPECSNAMNVDLDGNPIKPIITDVKCVLCGKPMQLRKSKRGPFLGCTGYPECTSTLPSDEHGVPLKKIKPEELNEKCTECGAPMAVKFARGRSFLGCTTYPTCKATRPVPAGIYIEKPPAEQAGVGCDKCGRPMVIRKSRRGPFLSCSGFPRCRNAKSMDKLEELKTLAAEGKIPAPPDDSPKGKSKAAAAVRGKRTATKGKAVYVDVSTLGPPPAGFAWTRTGRPVVETWPASGTLTCPECGGDMAAKSGRFGPFFGCSKCRATANLRGGAKKRAETEVPQPDRPKPIPTEIDCPDCGKKMFLRMGKTGRFLGCSGYPKCRKTMEAPPGLLRDVGAAGPA